MNKRNKIIKKRNFIQIIDNILYIKKLIFCLLLFIIFHILTKNIIIETDEVTLITGLFKIKSKYSFNKYLIWVKNFLQINASIVFFIDKSISKDIKNLRPKIYNNKTVWIETDINQFYSYKNFFKYFNKSYEIDHEKRIHSVFLYLVWAEKCNFVKRAIYKNYFKSKCFYWIDAGFFKNRMINRYLNGWPSKKKCFDDPRVIINSMRKIDRQEIKNFTNLNINFYNSFIRKPNVGGGLFGGKKKYLLRFITLYYKTIKLFVKKLLFIGKDQNLFAYISYLHKDIINIIYSGDWVYLAKYLLN